MPGEPVIGEAPRWSLAGKMPSAGDFLRRQIAPATARRIDDWLDTELSRRAAEDADDWADRFVAAGPRRFRLGPDVLGPDPAFGVIAPSRDAVGRGYALVIFASAPVDTRDAAACVARALVEIASADALLAWLAAVSPDDAGADATPASGEGLWASDDEGEAWRRIEGLPATEAFDRLFAGAVSALTTEARR